MNVSTGYTYWNCNWWTWRLRRWITSGYECIYWLHVLELLLLYLRRRVTSGYVPAGMYGYVSTGYTYRNHYCSTCRLRRRVTSGYVSICRLLDHQRGGDNGTAVEGAWNKRRGWGKPQKILLLMAGQLRKKKLFFNLFFQHFKVPTAVKLEGGGLGLIDLAIKRRTFFRLPLGKMVKQGQKSYRNLFLLFQPTW